MDSAISGWLSGLADRCGPSLLGMYVTGSTAAGGFSPAVSDIDAIAVMRQPVSDEELAALELGLVGPPPGRGLDLEFFALAGLRRPDRQLPWRRWIRWDTDDGPAPQPLCGRSEFDWAPDLAMARDRGIVVTGPPPAAVFGPIPQRIVLRAVIDAVRVWASRDHFGAPASGILNACRAWLYWDQGRLGSKIDGAQWALPQVPDPDLLERALHYQRTGRPEPFDDPAVKGFIGEIYRRIQQPTATVDRIRDHDVVLRSGAVTLRPATERDWPLYEAWNSDPEVLWFAEGDDVTSRSAAEVRAITRGVSRDALCFIIEHDGRPVGDCWLQLMNLPRVLDRHPGLDCRRIDLTIGEKTLWGSGIGTRVIAMLTRHAL
jgi:streptomycin 3"-adenylyltransferase